LTLVWTLGCHTQVFLGEHLTLVTHDTGGRLAKISAGEQLTLRWTFWWWSGTARTAASKQVHEYLNGRTGTAAQGSCFARTLENGLVDVVATLDKVLCDARCGFLCGFFATSAQRADYALAESLNQFFAEVAG
jgi:hypothetical protein